MAWVEAWPTELMGGAGKAGWEKETLPTQDGVSVSSFVVAVGAATLLGLVCKMVKLG